MLLHCLLGCLVVGTIGYFVVPKLFGKGGALRGIKLPELRPGKRRGLFGVQGVGGAEELGVPGSGEELEFGFCFDVSELAADVQWRLPKHTHCASIQRFQLKYVESY